MVPLFSQLSTFSFWPNKCSPDPVASPQREAATAQTFESGLADFVAEREQQAPVARWWKMSGMGSPVVGLNQPTY